ncbi:hypothetical protein SAMN05421770_101250 [Granulicella rosea]|uniref:Uncharacterized protein n=1 Tax=Granulicella rosea TaxID=474952 RepID=A0A239D346_9BACT|nr:hypothetical protein [Granulicella rosea]SNS26458.1 hypothetical protein SAMN05421770_101250 [Granulicella rosea]
MKIWRRTVASLAVLTASTLHAQKTPQQIVEAAVQTELAADKSDTSCWVYRDHDVTPGKDAVWLTADTPVGSVRRKVEDHGQPLTPAQTAEETAHIQQFLGDKGKQQKQQKDSDHDDREAENLLKLLPVAFNWTVKSDEGERATLAFAPKPDFHPQSMEARVMSNMTGEIVVEKSQNRIARIHGTLENDVTIGWGMLGRLRKGGTFNILRKEVAPGHWQVTDSHIHIQGKALFFKTINEQEDDTKTDFKLSTAKTLPEAAVLVNAKP